MGVMRRTSILLFALSALAACHVGGRRGAPMPVGDSNRSTPSDQDPVADSGELLDGTGARTDRLALVPNLVGYSSGEAAKFAQRSGFEVVSLRVPGSPAGQVLSQDLTPGREAPMGSPIGIRVASGKGIATSVGQPGGPAAPSGGSGWEDVTTSPSATAVPDMTTPRPESQTGPASDPAFVTPSARGVVVPPVLDRTPEQARRILEDAGLRYREEVATSGVPGRVMDQDPPAGARRPAGTEIVVKIPLESPALAGTPPADPAGEETPASSPVARSGQVIVPSVLDKTEAVARRILEDLGLKPRGEPTTSGVTGRVMDQLPSPGASVEPGTSIVIRIPGLAVADPAEPAGIDPAGAGPASEWGAPDAAPSTAAEPLPPAVALTPPAPPAPPEPVTTPEPASPPQPIFAPPLPIATTEPMPPPAPQTPPTDEERNEPIFASPPRATPAPDAPAVSIESTSGPNGAGTGSSSGDALPPPMPMPEVPVPAVPAPEVPVPENPVVSPEPPTPAPPVVVAEPETPPEPILPPPVVVLPVPDEAPAPTDPPTAPIESTPEPDGASALPPPLPVVTPPPPADAPAPVAAPVDASALAVPTLRAPLDDAYFKLAPRVVVETTWEVVAEATGYLLEVEELADGVWVGVERRVVKGTRAIVDLEPTGGKAQDFRWRVRTVVARRGGRPTAWAVFHAR